MTKQQKEVAEKANSELAVINFEADGQEATKFDQDDLTTPFLKILQKMSPEIDEDSSDFVEGAKVGMFINTSSKQLTSAPAVIIPCGYDRQFLEWVPRDLGGGFKGPVAKDYALGLERDDRGRYVTAEGHHVLDTRVWYVLQVIDGELVPAVMSLKSTSIKRSKELGDIISSIRLPRADGTKFRPADYSHTYVVSVTHETSGEDTWKLPKFAIGEQITDPAIYTAAKEFSEIVAKGGAKVDHSKSEDTGSSAGGGNSGGGESEDF